MTPTLLELAERAANAGCDLACQLCGEEDFDIPGLVYHWRHYCEVTKAVTMGRNNAEVAENLRARSSAQENPDG